MNQNQVDLEPGTTMRSTETILEDKVAKLIGKNYDKLKASTKTVNLVSFTGPLDFKGK